MSKAQGKKPMKQAEPEPEDEYDEDEEDYEDEEGPAEGAEEDDEYVELDLERTLTWTGNAVVVQAGGEFRMPLIVPHPSVLGIQFEVDNGAPVVRS